MCSGEATQATLPIRMDFFGKSPGIRSFRWKRMGALNCRSELDMIVGPRWRVRSSFAQLIYWYVRITLDSTSTGLSVTRYGANIHFRTASSHNLASSALLLKAWALNTWPSFPITMLTETEIYWPRRDCGHLGGND